ncbi:MAG TPA: DUF2735 domain-containing protein [Xanthobacteraceae bacterium]|nr:DUF2735 domain-containing protein [Xanthobacteraceae bacterium]
MTTSLHRPSATIYAFPKGGRASIAGNRGTDRLLRELAELNLPATSFGSGWYHDAAIQDAEPVRKN